MTDLVWINVIYGPFLRSKVWLLFTLLVFLMSQSILKTWQAEDEATQGTLRIATLGTDYLYRCCPCFSGMTLLIAGSPIPESEHTGLHQGLRFVELLFILRACWSSLAWKVALNMSHMPRTWSHGAKADLLAYKNKLQSHQRGGHRPAMSDPCAL